jgi:hypothetical protein
LQILDYLEYHYGVAKILSFRVHIWCHKPQPVFTYHYGVILIAPRPVIPLGSRRTSGTYGSRDARVALYALGTLTAVVALGSRVAANALLAGYALRSPRPLGSHGTGTTGTALGSALPLVALFAALRKKGVDIEAVMRHAAETLETAGNALALIKPFVETSGGYDTVDRIFSAATKAVDRAEQLAKIEQIPKEGRKAAAVAYVNDTLKLAGVEVTPEVAALVDGAVEASVGALGHSPDLPVFTSGFAQITDEIPCYMGVTTSASIDPHPPDAGAGGTI